MIGDMTRQSRRRVWMGALCLVGLLGRTALLAQAVPGAENIIQNGLFADDPKRPVHWVTRDSGNLGTFEVTPAPKGERSGILTVEVKRVSAQPWTLELRQKLQPRFKGGETLYITFEYKITEGYAFHFYWQKDSSPWPKFLALRIAEPVNEWHRCMVAVPVHEDLAERQTSLSFHLAEKIGTVHFRNVAAFVVPEDMDTRDLETNVEPVFGGDYYDKDWRQKALDRLDKVRKADLNITVTQAKKPVPNAKVTVQQKSRPFQFGITVKAPLLVDGALKKKPFAKLARMIEEHKEHLAKFRERVTDRSLFDIMTFEDALIWRNSVEWGNDLAPEAITQIKEKGFIFRGFALYIPAFRYAPPRCRQMASDELLTAVETFIRRQTQRYRGKIDQWCVIHGALSYEEIYDIIGVDSLVKCVAVAKRGDPDAALLVSDNEALLVPSEGHLRETLEFVNWLRAEGAQIDGLALNARLTRPYIAPQAMETRLDMIAGSTDLPVHITNLEVEAAREQIQADMLRDLILLFYSHPTVKSVSVSRIWEAASINGKSSLYRNNMAVKPAGKMLTELLTDEWITKEEVTTGEDGTAVVRGFKGDYTVTVGEGENAVTKDVALTGAAMTLSVELP